MWQAMNLTNVGVIVAKLIVAGMLFWAMGGTATQHTTHSTGHRHAAHAASPRTPAPRGGAGHGYDYYVLLRWAVCGIATFAAFRAFRFKRKGWGWALAIVALFFNPIFPVHLNRETWAFIDLGAALLLLVSIAVVDLRLPSTWSRGGEAIDPGQREADRVK